MVIGIFISNISKMTLDSTTRKINAYQKYVLQRQVLDANRDIISNL